MKDRPFVSYLYSAFISYTTGDDRDWNSFVSFFTNELNLTLPSRTRVRDIKVRKAYRSGDNPLVAGRLSEKLRAKVDASFAMFLFVHDNYLTSSWCLHELEYFKSLFGDDGFRERLYVIAMSESAITTLTNREQWKRLCPFDDQLWLPFFRDDKSDQPMDIYAPNTRSQPFLLVKPFWDLFVDVREDLAKKIRSAVEKEQRAPSYPSIAVERVVPLPEDDLVRVYIEGNKDQEECWESLGQQVESSWNQVVEALRVEPRLYLRPTGLPMNEIDQRPMLDDADGVVLLWGKKTPDSLAAQIKKVEPKLSGPNYAPGVIAYLMDGPNDLPGARSVGNWNVVRFTTGADAGADGSARVLPDDDARELEAFLSSVLDRKRKRR
jgi:hypothetical protein